jgi:hypothetical protein
MWQTLLFYLRASVSRVSARLLSVLESGYIDSIVNISSSSPSLPPSKILTRREVMENAEKLSSLITTLERLVSQHEYSQSASILGEWRPRLWISLTTHTEIEDPDVELIPTTPNGQYYRLSLISEWMLIHQDTMHITLQNYLVDCNCHFETDEERNLYLQRVLDQFNWWSQINHNTLIYSEAIQRYIFNNDPSAVSQQSHIFPSIQVSHLIAMMQSPNILNMPRAIIATVPRLNLQ